MFCGQSPQPTTCIVPPSSIACRLEMLEVPTCTATAPLLVNNPKAELLTVPICTPGVAPLINTPKVLVPAHCCRYPVEPFTVRVGLPLVGAAKDHSPVPLIEPRATPLVAKPSVRAPAL